jgi:hypothetical protein
MQNVSTHLTATGLLAVSTPCFANDFEKNNVPCVAEFCLGDGLAELRKVNWNRATIADATSRGKRAYVADTPPHPSDAKDLIARFPGKHSAAASRYLLRKGFDSDALPLLQKVTVSCGAEPLQGNFTTKTGNPTIVEIALMPDPKDLSIQRWTIVTIRRRYPDAKTPTQQAELRKLLDERYGRFDMLRNPIRGGAPALYAISEAGMGDMGFFLSLKIADYLGTGRKPGESYPLIQRVRANRSLWTNPNGAQLAVG